MTTFETVGGIRGNLNIQKNDGAVVTGIHPVGPTCRIDLRPVVVVW